MTDPAPIVNRAVALAPSNRLRLGVVTDPGAVGARRVSVAMDDGGQADALNAAGVLIQGDRVWVLFTTPQGAVAIDRVPDRWHEVDSPGEPAYQGTWATFGVDEGPVKFLRDRGGLVDTTGATLNSGTGLNGTVIWTYPARYRPGNRRSWPVASGAGPGRVAVLVNGDAVFFGTDAVANAGFALDPVKFIAEA